MMFKTLACLLAASTLAHGQRGVLREVWTQIDGSSINALVTSPNYPDAPLPGTVPTEFRSAQQQDQAERELRPRDHATLQHRAGTFEP